MTIDKSFIEKIESMAEVKILEIDGRKFTTDSVQRVLEPEAKSVGVHTLTGLVAFLGTLGADFAPIIHVRDYNNVAVVSGLFGINKQREVVVTAAAYELDHRFGQSIPVEDFIVYLQSMFVQDETTAKIMQVVGNLSQGTEAAFADDGMTQRVTAKAGVARVEVVDLPNPVELRPFRTFADIEQPASKFVLRIKADKDHGPRCSLHEADGGAWKNTAIATIRTWLTDKAVGVKIVA
ncbi:MAG: hypothetical protein OEV91_10190 [Desulfobulbaceae bacterium]|nr:hypothetical protein [Desulfobulbaceae bacterium]